MTRILILLLFIIAGLIVPSFAQEVPTPVRAKLVADIAAVKPGESFNLGVLMEIDPGWHVYWEYPGETGLPTRVQFKVPDGIRDGKINWPIPNAYHKPQGGIDFGYENSLLLWTNIDVPPNAELNSSFEIDATVSWISCKEICIPGKANLKFDAKVEDLRKPAETALFSAWQNSLPHILSESEIPFNVEVSPIKSDEERVRVGVTLASKSNANKIEYYPNPGDFLIVQNLKYATSPDNEKTEISFEVKAKNGVQLSETVLDGLIVFTNISGKRSGVELKIDFSDT
ncbi:MAG: protein-disulfide reductase DsbD family protein [Candidatus Dadabacteria bacterium]|nr:protein-disulfide reductase DsbD family protein [Candidatus Dadabacteria bacterium]